MSSQLGQVKASQPVQPNPYASVPGYRPDEPANSAWNRTILAYKSAGVPYSIERQETGQAPSSTKESTSVLGTSPSQTKSTNPALEEAIIGTFEREPSALKYAGNDQGSYLKGEYAKGVLTDLDFDKLNDIVNRYNANVAKENAKNFGLNQQNALGNGLISLSNKQIAAKNIQSGKEFSDFLQTYEKQNATFQIISKSGKVVGTTSGQRSYHDVLAAQKQFGQVKVQPILPGQQDTEKPFSIKEYLASSIGGFQKAVTTGKESNPVDYFIDVAKGAGSFFYQGTKQLAASAPIIGKEIFDTITTGRTQYQIKGATPISGFAASFLQPSLGFTPAQKTQYQSNLNQIDSFIGSVRTQAKSQGLAIPSGILTPKEGSAGAAIGGVIALGLSVYGAKELAPFRYEKYSLPLGETKQVITKTITGAPRTEQVPIFTTVYKGITLGYNAGKPLIGSYSGKLGIGLKPELLKYPQAAASGIRFELGTGSGFETRIFKSDKTQAYLKQQGLLPERTEKAVDLGMRITKESAKTPEVQFQKGYSFTQEPFLKLQGKEQMGALQFLASRQSILKTAGKGTKIGRVHGSLSEIPVAVPELALKAHDIDVRVSNDMLGEKTAKGLSDYLNTIAEKGRGFVSTGKQTILQTGGKEEKVAEFLNMENAVEYSSATQSSERVFNQKLPSGFKRYSIIPGGPRLKVTPGRFQTLRRSASVFSLKGEKNPITGKYEFNVGPEEHRLKDVAKLYARQLSEAQANFLKGNKARGFRQQSQSRELKEIFGNQIDVEKYIIEERLGKTKPEAIEVEPVKSSSQQFKDVSSGVLSKSSKFASPSTMLSSSPISSNKSENIKNMSKSSNIFSKSSSSFDSFSRTSKFSKSSKVNTSSSFSKFSTSRPSKSNIISKSFSSTFNSPSNTSPSPPSKPSSGPFSTSPISKPSGNPSYPSGYPSKPFDNKKKLPGFPFGFDSENGPGSPVGGGGLKKNFLGNVPEFAFTGMFNKTEIKYAKAGGVPREYKSGKPAFNAFTKASGQQAGGKQKITAKSQESSFLFDKFSSQGKKSSKQSKPLSNKFTRLI